MPCRGEEKAMKAGVLLRAALESRIGFKAARTGELREGHKGHCVGLKGL